MSLFIQLFLKEKIFNPPGGLFVLDRFGHIEFSHPIVPMPVVEVGDTVLEVEDVGVESWAPQPFLMDGIENGGETSTVRSPSLTNLSSIRVAVS